MRNIIFYWNNKDFKRNAVTRLRECEQEYCKGTTKAMVSAFLGEIEELKKYNKEELMETDDEGNTLLHYCAMMPGPEVARTLPKELLGK